MDVPRSELERRRCPSGVVGGLAGGVLEHEADLEEGVAAEIALGAQLLHEHLERHILVGVRAEADLARARSSSRKVGLPERSVRRTSELTKNPIRCSLSVRVRPAIGAPTTTSSWPAYRARSDWNAASSVIEQRRPLGSREGVHRHGELRGNRERADSPRKLWIGARAVGRKRKHRQIGERALPVVELRIECLAGQALSLPDREVGVLDRKERHVRIAAARKGAVVLLEARGRGSPSTSRPR